MSHYLLLARLLDYPSAELIAHLDAVGERLAQAEGLDTGERAQVAGVLEWMAASDLLALQGHYVDTFDLTPDHSLHLTHHTHGESRERGPALVELSERYRAAGLERDERELPDYLPMVLEFLATCPAADARRFLGELAALLAPMAESLERAGSPYAPLIRLIESRGRLARTAA